MGRCSTLLVFSLLTLSINAQVNRTYISGTINANQSKIFINENEITPDENGYFLYQFSISSPSYVILKSQDEIALFLYPGDSLILNTDAGDFLNQMDLRGDRAELNTFLITEIINSQKISNYVNKNYKWIFSLKTAQWKAQLRLFCLPFKKRLGAFISKHPDLDSFFIKSQNAMITYSCAELLLKYPDLHRDLTHNQNYKPDDSYFDFLETLDMNDADLISIDEYTSFLETYLKYKFKDYHTTEVRNKFQYYKRLASKLAAIEEIFSDPVVRDEMLYLSLEPYFSEHNFRNADKIIEKFSSLCNNPSYLNEINEKYQSQLELPAGCEVEIYKTIGNLNLEAYIFKPENSRGDDRLCAVAFFHGGGWDVGKPQWGFGQCRHFSSKGLVAISFEYRLRTRHDSTPIESIADAKSALRWMRKNADQLGIDPNRIIASGFSAGGHIALCTAMVEGYDEPGEDTNINAAANAMLLWVTPARIFPGWFTMLLAGRGELDMFNPIHLVRPGLPPMIFFQGDADNTVPAWTIEEFQKEMKKAGNRCDLHLYQNQTHLGWGENTEDVMEKMDEFLGSLGYL